MLSRTYIAAVSLLGAFGIGSGTAVLAQPIVEAQTWDDAISKFDCSQISRNADGSFSVTAVVKVDGAVQHNPIINVPHYTAELEAKNCSERAASPARL
jgi:hypothetical protein